MKYMTEKLRLAKLRINNVEKKLLIALEEMLIESDGQLTTAEIGAAMLRILQSINGQEIKDCNKD